METSSNTKRAGLALIQHFEGCRLHAYPDPATGGTPWTIGWGSTGPDINSHTTWTQEQADARLLATYDELDRQISTLVGRPLTDNQRGALVSFAYNLGLGRLKNSTLLRHLRAGDVEGAAQHFIEWDRANGREMEGLKRRRMGEAALFARA